MNKTQRQNSSERIALLRFIGRQEAGVVFDRQSPHHMWLLKKGYVTSRIHQPNKEIWPEVRLCLNDTGRAAIAAADTQPAEASA